MQATRLAKNPLASDMRGPNERLASARKYVRKMAPSIQGQRGHDRLFAAAMTLRERFDLDAEGIRAGLLEEFNPRCKPEWSDKEIEHKVNEAMKKGDPMQSQAYPRRSQHPSSREPRTGEIARVTESKVLPEQPPKKKHWPDAETAKREFEKLPLARDDAEVREFLKAEYGLQPGALPDNWRVLALSGMKGIAYTGKDAQGNLCALKWKSLDRDERSHEGHGTQGVKT